jgi:hypothetical protein
MYIHKKTYYLNKEKTETIKLKWGFFFYNLIVTVNGIEVGRIKNFFQLRKGKTFTLPNGQELFVRLIRVTSQQFDLEVLVDGNPVSGSATHPDNMLRFSFAWLMIFAFINIVLGGIAIAQKLNLFTLINPERLEKLLAKGPFMFHSFVQGETAFFFSGLIVAILAYFIRYRYSMIALIIVMVLLLTDALWLGQVHGWPEFEFVESTTTNKYFLAEPWGSIAVNVVILFCLALSVDVIQRKKQENI